VSEERSLEVRVGALVLLGIGGVLGLLWLMGELTLSRGVPVHVRFAHTGNVVKGAPVKFGGVVIGHVDRIDIDPNHRAPNGEPQPVAMELGIHQDVASALHQDASVAVATQGPLGEAYLELTPGSATAPILTAGQEIRGVEPVRLDQMIARLGRILQTAGGALEKNPDALPRLIESVGKLTKKLDDALAENPQAMNEIVTNLIETSKELHGLSVEARSLLGPGGKGTVLIDNAAAGSTMLRQKLPSMLNSADKAFAGAAKVTGEFSEEDAKQLKLAIKHYSDAGEKLDRIAEHADHILGAIDAGQGSVGGIMKDPQIYLDIKALVAELKAHPWKVLWKD
jgi:phospholipid/cholesterol/gamma-HCH transport system substrate-binding protein